MGRTLRGSLMRSLPAVRAFWLKSLKFVSEVKLYSEPRNTNITTANYVSGNQSIGRTTAAQWLRVAFHDFVTADVAAGIGGLDASIGFETLREENSGTAFNDSFSFFRPYVNPVISSKCFLVHQLPTVSGPRGRRHLAESK